MPNQRKEAVKTSKSGRVFRLLGDLSRVLRAESLSPNYLHTISYGFNWHTEKAWQVAAHNIKTHMEAVEH